MSVSIGNVDVIFARDDRVLSIMVRYLSFFTIFLIGLALTGCDLVADEPAVITTAVSLPTITASNTPSLPPTTEPNTPSPIPPSVTPSPAASLTPSSGLLDLSISQKAVTLYPVPEIFAGDKVTFQIRPYIPESIIPDTVSMTVFVDGVEVGRGKLNEFNLAGDAFGLIKWAWDTTDLIGEHQIQVVLDPQNEILVGDENQENNQVSFSVTVQDQELHPEVAANEAWVTAETACCHVHVVSGTAAYRDLPQLLVEVETAVQQATARLNEDPQKPLDIYFIDRIIGQGGYAGSELVISYLDRDYAGIALQQVLVHEAVHIIDRQIAPQRIAFLAEGLAVWASDGHYKPEDIDQLAAALLDLGLYVPLTTLVNDFYPVQHEIGYLQAASFVEYLISTHGWSRFREFYSDVTLDDAPTYAESLDLNLKIYYDSTLAEMEADWLSYLNELPWNQTAVTDLQTTILQYNTMRHYQQLYDPSAYFLNAWLPYPNEVRQTGNHADLTRHPQTEVNITLEIMLQAASEALQTGNYTQATALLDSVRRVLDSGGQFQDPLAQNYRNIVRLATTSGYQAQQVTLTGNQASVWVTAVHSNNLTRLNLVLDGKSWILVN